MLCNSENIDPRQIGRLNGNKFVVHKQQSKNHLLENFNGMGDGFAINSKILYWLKSGNHLIYVLFHKTDGTTIAYITKPATWLRLGFEFQVPGYELQVFLKLKDFEIILDGTDANQSKKLEQLRMQQESLKRYP